jgi:hypothetical protein
MKTLAVVSVVFLSMSAFGQHARIGNSIGANSGFGNVLFPGGKPNTGQPFTLQSPNFANVMGNVIAGRPAYQGIRGQNRFLGGGFGGYGGAIYIPYAYPVFSGGYYGDYGYGYGGGGAPPQQPSNVTVVYPPQQPNPVIIMGGPSGQPGEVPRSSIQDYGAPPAAQAQPSGVETSGVDTSGTQQQADYYLLAFKDHSIYSAIGYWVDGDTLHYLTGGNVHNQVSLSLVDRDLTAQLNRGRGVQVNLPPAK